MGGKSSAPAAPDPNQVSAAQTGSNVTTALVNAGLNRTTTNTPLGSDTWSTNGTTKITDPTTGKVISVPNYVENVSLNPTAQAAFTTGQQNALGEANTQAGFLKNVSQMLQNPVTAKQFGQINTGIDPSSMGDKGIQDAEQQSFNSQYSLVAPLMQQQTQQAEDQMRAEGIPEGSDLWNTNEQNIKREQANQISGLTSNAVNQGIQLQGQTTGQKIANAQLQNQGVGQQVQQALALQNEPLNELSALQSGSQVGTPSLSNAPALNVNPTDVAGNAYNSYAGNVNAANAANSSKNGLFGSLTGLAGSLGSAYLMSDRTMKKDVTDTGVKLYEYRYKGEAEDAPKHTGVMAQDVKKVRPDAVARMPNGKLAVKYAKLLGA